MRRVCTQVLYKGMEAVGVTYYTKQAPMLNKVLVLSVVG